MTHGKQMDILVVTADTDSPWYVGAGLTRRGFAVRRAGDATSALRSAAAYRMDVALLDFASDGLDGPKLARDLRGLRSCGHTPVLLVAVNAEETAGQADIDLSLRGDLACVAGVLVGVMNRFRLLLLGLRGDPCAAHRGTAVAGSNSRTAQAVPTPPQTTADAVRLDFVFTIPLDRSCDGPQASRYQPGSLMHKQHPNRTASLKTGSQTSRNVETSGRTESPDPATVLVPADAIRARAFQMWEQAGRPGGDGATFWLDAERELSVD